MNRCLAEGLYVRGARSFVGLLHIEFDLLVLCERLEAVGLDG